MKEKFREEQFENEVELQKYLVQKWKMYIHHECYQIIEKLLHRLNIMVEQDGERKYNH
jgi:hypothetical protein